jgi:hypothetical protein
MRDLRALRNMRNLDSYRAWEREGIARSGLIAFVLIVAASTPVFASVASLIEGATKGDARALVRLMGGALALYGLTVGGLMLFGVMRLNAWKRAHPWEPPPRSSAV